MPRPVTVLDGPQDIPDLVKDWWPDAPWWDGVVSRQVDELRTAALRRWDARVRVSGNTPLQRVAAKTTQVFTRKAPGTWRNPFPSTKVPLPQRTWISSNNDHTWYGIGDGTYWEAAALGPTVPWLETPWSADVVRVFDLGRRWEDQPGSISASRIPTWALVPTVAELDRGDGGVRHALAFVAAGYGAGSPVWPSRGTDGYLTGHPLTNGTRLRFTAEAVARLSADVATAHDAAVLHAGAVHGFLVVDKTSEDAGHAIRLPDSPRLDIRLGLRLTDLEVLSP